MGEEETRVVRWFMCNCDVISKYCDEYHTARARVPLSVLEHYELPPVRS